MEIANAGQGSLFFGGADSFVKFAEVPTRTEAARQGAVDDQRVRRFFQGRKSSSEALQLGQKQRAHLIAGLAMQRQLDDAVHEFPGDRLALVAVHCWFSQSFKHEGIYTAFFAAYISSMWSWKCRAMASRFSLPIAVSRPLSAVRPSLVIRNARTCL